MPALCVRAQAEIFVKLKRYAEAEQILQDVLKVGERLLGLFFAAAAAAPAPAAAFALQLQHRSMDGVEHQITSVCAGPLTPARTNN